MANMGAQVATQAYRAECEYEGENGMHAGQLGKVCRIYGRRYLLNIPPLRKK